MLNNILRNILTILIIILVVYVLYLFVYPRIIKYFTKPVINKVNTIDTIDTINISDDDLINYKFAMDSDLPNLDKPCDENDLYAEKKCETHYNNKFVGGLNNTEALHNEYKELVGLIENYYDAARFNVINLPVEGPLHIEKRNVFEMARKFIKLLQNKTGTSYKIEDITNSYKYKTDKETKFIFDIVLKKETPKESSTKIVLNVSLVRDNWTDQTKFFKGEVYETETRIEYIYIAGFVSKDNQFIQEYDSAYDKRQSDFYAFEQLEDDILMDKDCVKRIVDQKKREHLDEVDTRNTNYDEDGKGFYDRDFLETKFGTSMIEK